MFRKRQLLWRNLLSVLFELKGWLTGAGLRESCSSPTLLTFNTGQLEEVPTNQNYRSRRSRPVDMVVQLYTLDSVDAVDQ